MVEMPSPHNQKRRIVDSVPDIISEAIKVQPQSLKEWVDYVGVEHQALRVLKSGVSDRKLRTCLNKIDQKVSEIIRNCENVDPDDIRTEIALDILLKQFNDTIEGYLSRISLNQSPAVNLGHAFELSEKKYEWLENLLVKMRANDSDDPLIRARVLSSIFESQRENDNQ